MTLVQAAAALLAQYRVNDVPQEASVPLSCLHNLRRSLENPVDTVWRVGDTLYGSQKPAFQAARAEIKTRLERGDRDVLKRVAAKLIDCGDYELAAAVTQKIGGCMAVSLVPVLTEAA